jgi:hypothetical protein
MYDIKVLNNKCKMGGGDVNPQCFVKDLLWVVNLVCKKEDSVYCYCYPTTSSSETIWQFFFLLFFTDWKTSLNNFIPVHLTVISPHHRRLCFYFWTFVCSNCDIFHLLGTDKCWCKTILAQNTHNQTALPLQVQIRSCKKSDDSQ